MASLYGHWYRFLRRTPQSPTVRLVQTRTTGLPYHYALRLGPSGAYVLHRDSRTFVLLDRDFREVGEYPSLRATRGAFRRLRREERFRFSQNKT